MWNILQMCLYFVVYHVSCTISVPFQANFFHYEVLLETNIIIYASQKDRQRDRYSYSHIVRENMDGDPLRGRPRRDVWLRDELNRAGVIFLCIFLNYIYLFSLCYFAVFCLLILGVLLCSAIFWRTRRQQRKISVENFWAENFANYTQNVWFLGQCN